MSGQGEQALRTDRGVTPMFLFSLPRSGSTLLQRILTAHPLIASGTEPGVLIPPLLAQRGEGVTSIYDHPTLSRFMRYFLEETPSGLQSYRRSVREFALSIYSAAATNGQVYFLDKTPKYHLVAREIIEMFPDARFIFLWRNPLSVVASLVDSFGRGAWNVHRHSIDLFQGIESLTETVHLVENPCVIRYEDLLADPEVSVSRITSELGLEGGDHLLERFDDVVFKGGDLHGTRRYRQLSREPLNKWKTTMARPIRKAWSRRYLQWIGDERLALMGYKLDELLAEVDDLPSRLEHLVSDAMHVAFGIGYTAYCSRELKIPHRAWPPPLRRADGDL